MLLCNNVMLLEINDFKVVDCNWMFLIIFFVLYCNYIICNKNNFMYKVGKEIGNKSLFVFLV